MPDEVTKPEKGSQKMMISGMIILPPGDFFTTAKRAEAASEVLNEAAAKVAETFPGFKFTVDVSPWREHSGGRKPKNSGATEQQPAPNSADAAAASNGSAAAEGSGDGSAAAGEGGAWPPGGAEGYQGASAAEAEQTEAAKASAGRQTARQAAR